jgi:hypothetical protein
MEYPDHLKTPVRMQGSGSADLGDLLADELLRDAASWDPDAELPVPAIPGRGLFESAEQLRNGEPEPVYRALSRLAWLGAWPRQRRPHGQPALAWPTAARPGAGPPGAGSPGDPRSLIWPVAGRDTARAVGVQEALKTPGVRLICITGQAGVGKTRLATDIANESRGRMLTAGRVERDVPLLTIRLRSVESRAGERRLLAMTADDALVHLLLALGVADCDIPASGVDRRDRYLAELAGRRPVILIDDAVAENQVEPLLPAEAGVVVVTSRDGVRWSSVTGMVNVPVAPLDVHDTGTLVRAVFRAFGAEPDEATATAVYDWCGGTPRPVILISLWLAATGKPAASLATARRDWAPAHGELAGTGVMPGFRAVAAMLGLLGGDQQVIVRMFGMVRLPESDLAAVCAATGLSRERALAALGELTALGLLSRTGPAGVWTMPPGTADYAAAWAWAADPHTYELLLDPLLMLYERRVHGLLDAHAALARTDAAAAGEWAAAEVVAAADAASAHLAAVTVLGGRVAGRWNADRLIDPVLAVAQAAGDVQLAASARERLGLDGDRPAEEADRPLEVADPPGRAAPSGAARPPEDTLAVVAAAAEDTAIVRDRPVIVGARA